MKLHQTPFLLLVVLSYSLFAQSSIGIASSAAKLLPSVVKIKIQRSEAIAQENELIQSDSGGSGFVFDSNHHILTNAHVIKDAKKIVVVDFNNTEYPATLLAKDEKTDLAILDVPTFNAPPLLLGNSTQLALGDNVFVLGAPYSLGLGVTVGVISAIAQFLPNYPYQYFIQTDAAINPGNSGGPLFNQNGELIAVASMTFLRSGSYTNIGFAIPVNEAFRIANLLISQKKIDRGYLGADLLISDKVSRKLGFPSSVLITHIDPKSPADLAGLKAGDILIELNDEKFTNNGTLHRYLQYSKPNDSLKLTYLRDKKYSKAILSLGITPSTNTPTTNIATADQAEKLGLVLQDGSDNESVKIVLSYGSAKVSGLTTGDTIVQINATRVKTIKEFNTQLSKLKDNELAIISVRRNGDLIALPLGSKTALQGYSTQN
ncbi:MAG: trypsin-like peptidase domain-containing protein [Sulfuricurvum sp.]|nr:trypsin-like peptidase domain-containing protein [Sulfuricurvum sp.]